MIDNELEITIGEGSIHATHHRADGRHFVAVAPPLFEESARLRKVLVNLSRFLCSHGYDVVRFDYHGTGYSPGRFEDVTLERAGKDLEHALGYCHESGAVETHVIGVRFGAYVALRALDNTLNGRVVAWEPVVDPAAYIKEVLRSEVATQMLIYGEVRRDRDRMVEIIRDEGKLYVEGYCVCRDLHDQLASGSVVTPDGLTPNSGKTSFIYWQTRREHKRWSSAGIHSHWVDGVRLAYNHIRHLEPRSDALYQCTLEELKRGG
jgi:alpha/beta superfamily hydrolase